MSNQKAPDVSVLIVAYNSADLIAECLDSIPQACVRFDYEVLMVDNGDGSTQALVAKAFSEVQIVPSIGNVGFAAGNNLLAEQAMGRNLLLLNPDMKLKAGAIDALLDASSNHSNSAAWGGVTLDEDDQPDLGNTVHLPSLSEMASRVIGRSSAATTGQIDFTRDAKVKVLSGSFVMFDRKAWDEVGGLDARYFLYCEEVDLFYRLSLRGYDFWRVGAARGNHFIGHGEAINETRMLYRAAGIMQFASLHWSKPRQFLAFLLQWLAAWQRIIVGALIGRWSSHLRTVGLSHRALALRPNYWRHGYHPERGLLARLSNKSD